MLFSRRPKSSPGFTLIEMAIVLVVIGLILGMVFKGRELIDQARVKRMAANYNKIIGGLNTFYDRYGFYPGDGCVTRTPASPMDCTGTRDGILDDDGDTNDGIETEAAWYLLIDVTDILTEADRESVYGQPWDFIGGVDRIAGVSENTTGTWMDLPGTAQADPRVVCSLDKNLDDGDADTGNILTPDSSYTPDTDCWGLSGQVNVHLKVLP